MTTPSTISAEEFRERSQKDPAWCTKLIQPLEVTGDPNMQGSPITHLSPFLKFVGNSADFQNCNLQLFAGEFAGPINCQRAVIVEIHPQTKAIGNTLMGIAADFEGAKIGKLQGNYEGSLQCKYAQIQEIGELSATDETGWAANFEGVTGLKTARGKFFGLVEFSESTIEEIDGDPTTGLIVEIADDERIGTAAGFVRCPYLKVARGQFNGGVNFMESGIEKIDTDPKTGLRIEGSDNDGIAANFTDCKNLKTLEGTIFHGVVNCNGSGVEAVRLKNFKARHNGSGMFCYLEETPLLEKSPVDAGMAMLGTTSLEELEKRAEYQNNDPDIMEKVLIGIHRAKLARHKLKAKPNIEL